MKILIVLFEKYGAVVGVALAAGFTAGDGDFESLGNGKVFDLKRCYPIGVIVKGEKPIGSKVISDLIFLAW